jgi:hypothetical protein
MVGRFLRWTGALVLAIFLAWEIAGESPLLVLLAGFVAAWGLAIYYFVNLPREIQEWRAKGDARERGERTRLIPRIPWGLDLVSVMAGLVVGLATNWWLGIGAWLVITGLWWAGWISTRRYVRPDDPPSRRIRLIAHLTMWPLLAGLWLAILILAAVKWGEAGFLGAALGIGAYSFIVDRFAELLERGHATDKLSSTDR